jgi:hypothetical protein
MENVIMAHDLWNYFVKGHVVFAERYFFKWLLLKSHYCKSHIYGYFSHLLYLQILLNKFQYSNLVGLIDEKNWQNWLSLTKKILVFPSLRWKYSSTPTASYPSSIQTQNSIQRPTLFIDYSCCAHFSSCPLLVSSAAGIDRKGKNLAIFFE